MIDKSKISRPLHLVSGEHATEHPRLARSAPMPPPPRIAPNNPPMRSRFIEHIHDGPSMSDSTELLSPEPAVTRPSGDDGTWVAGSKPRLARAITEDGTRRSVQEARPDARLPLKKRPLSAGDLALDSSSSSTRSRTRGALGNAWSGVKGIFSFSSNGRNSGASVDGTPAAEALAPPTTATAPFYAAGDVPSRDEFAEMYQKLMASGAFAARTHESSRFPAPGGSARPSTDTHMRDAPSFDEPAARLHGLKRMHTGSDAGDRDSDSGDDAGSSRPIKTVKKLRRSASRISVELGLRKKSKEVEREPVAAPPRRPRPQNYYPPSASTSYVVRSGVATRRSFSAGNRETTKLAKRSLAVAAAAADGSQPARPKTSSGPSAPARPLQPLGAGSDHNNRAVPQRVAGAASSKAVLRQDQENAAAADASRTVVPDPHRGIPQVPAIPRRFKP